MHNCCLKCAPSRHLWENKPTGTMSSALGGSYTFVAQNSISAGGFKQELRVLFPKTMKCKEAPHGFFPRPHVSLHVEWSVL